LSKLQRFGHVRATHARRALEISHGARHAEHTVVGARGKPQPARRLEQQAPGGVVGLAGLSKIASREPRVAGDAQPGQSARLAIPSRPHARRHRRRRFACEIVVECGRRYRRHRHGEIHAVPQGP
jgi:hypothetical protein